MFLTWIETSAMLEGRRLEQSSHMLSAYFAEFEDRLNRGKRPAPPRTNT